MIILVVHVNDVGTFELECNTPVATNPNRPASTTPAFQFMEIKTWKVHIPGAGGSMEAAENQSDPALMPGLDACLGAFQKELFQPLVFEIPDHSITVTRYVTGVNCSHLFYTFRL